ncbi:hypothetical protein JB92DRAFT_1749008 [Gautieria morchelliformis]|nr:hypothetical protein JB92DRAFT_1749008 [Gautieria morchelliformis]
MRMEAMSQLRRSPRLRLFCGVRANSHQHPPQFQGTRIQEEYWLHQEYFPCHRNVSEEDECELIATLAQNSIGVITSGVIGCNVPTSFLDGPQLESILGITNNLTSACQSDGSSQILIIEIFSSRLRGKLWSEKLDRCATMEVNTWVWPSSSRVVMAACAAPIPVGLPGASVLLC